MDPKIRAGPSLAWLAAACLLPSTLVAQDDPDGLDVLAGEPVRQVVLQGVEAVDREKLKGGLSVKELECATPIYTLFCWVSDAGLFVDTYPFEPEEFRKDELRIQVFYWRRGFRHTQVESRARAVEGGVRVAFEVSEGEPTVVDSLTIVRPSQVLDEKRIVEADIPRTGEPLDLIRLGTAVVRLQEALVGQGHGNATVRREVDLLDSLRAKIRIVLEPGPVTTVEGVVLEGNEEVSDRTIRRLLELEAGDPLGPSDLWEAQRRLYASELFRRAQVLVPPEESEDSAKMLVARVEEGQLWAFDTGVGVSTTDFGQVEAGLTRYHFLGGARRLDLRAAVGNLLASQLFGTSIFDAAVPEGLSSDVRDEFLDPTYRASLNFRDPYFLGTKNSLGASIFGHRRSVPGVVIDRGGGASLTVGRELARGLLLDVGYRFELSELDAGQLYFCVNFGVCRLPTTQALQETQKLSPLTIRASLDRTHDPVFPIQGIHAVALGEWADEATFSDYRYTRLQADAIGYISLGPGTLSLRGRAGWVDALEGTNESLGITATPGPILHPATRFYSGGARSVRGYAQDQLGPRILTVDPTDLTEAQDPAVCTGASLSKGTCDPGFLDSGSSSQFRREGAPSWRARRSTASPSARSYTGSSSWTPATWVTRTSTSPRAAGGISRRESVSAI